DIDTFIELHIEQGRVLESSRMPLAVVTAIVGTAHLEMSVTGRPDHAGTTPMELRQDALAGAAAMIQAIESIARSLGRPGVATVTTPRVWRRDARWGCCSCQASEDVHTAQRKQRDPST